MRWKSPHPESLNNLGVYKMRKKDFAAAQTLFERAVRYDKEYSVARYNLAVAQMKGGREKEAVENLKVILQADPKHFAAWKNLGICRSRADDYAKAWEAMERAIQLNPSDEDAVVYGASYLKKLGRADEVAALYQKTYEAGGKSAAIYRFLGLKALKEKKDDVAADFYQRAIQLDPSADACFNLGLVLRRQNKLEAAADAYTKSVRLDPQHAKAWLNLGYIRMKQERFDESKECFQKAERADPKYENAQRAQQELEALLFSRNSQAAVSKSKK